MRTTVYMPRVRGPFSFTAYAVLGGLWLLWLMVKWTGLGTYYLFKYALWVPAVWLWQGLRWSAPRAVRGASQVAMLHHVSK